MLHARSHAFKEQCGKYGSGRGMFVCLLKHCRVPNLDLYVISISLGFYKHYIADRGGPLAAMI